MSKYVISKDGKELGPFSLSEVLSKITQRELELFDYIYDESSKDWILLTEHQDITQALKAQKPKGPPKTVEAAKPVEPSSKKDPVCPVVEIAAHKEVKSHKSTAADAHGIQWYVMKGETQFGPFSKGELVRMLQERTVYEFDFIWNVGMKDWTRLAEVKDFSIENMKTLFESKKEAGSFLDRKHPREKISGKIIVHNNDEFWVAEGKELSAGGLGLFVSNSMLVPGQHVHLHVPSINGKEPFNVIGEIVSKKFEQGVQSRTRKVEYGIRFTNLSQAQKSAKVAG